MHASLHVLSVILRFTSGVTLADVLVVSMAAKPFSCTYCEQALVWHETGIYCVPLPHNVRLGRHSTDLAKTARLHIYVILMKM